MKSNTWTIIKKEFARFFGDRQLLFTTVIMPGLLIYIIYSFMGTGMKKMATEGVNEQVTVCVENLPASVAPLVHAIIMMSGIYLAGVIASIVQTRVMVLQSLLFQLIRLS